jgi:hypothetical protein
MAVCVLEIEATSFEVSRINTSAEFYPVIAALFAKTVAFAWPSFNTYDAG